MIKIFWGFKFATGTDYHSENEMLVPNTGNQEMTEPEAVVYDRLGSAVGTITPAGVFSQYEGHRLPVRIELRVCSDGSGRAFADPPNVNARPRRPKWKENGSTFVF